MKSLRRQRLPRLDIPIGLAFPPVLTCLGTRPSQVSIIVILFGLTMVLTNLTIDTVYRWLGRRSASRA